MIDRAHADDVAAPATGGDLPRGPEAWWQAPAVAPAGRTALPAALASWPVLGPGRFQVVAGPNRTSSSRRDCRLCRAIAQRRAALHPEPRP